MDAILNARKILVEVENKGGKEDIVIDIGDDLTKEESSKLKEYLFMAGFTLSNEDNREINNNVEKMVLKRELYNETAVKDVLKSLGDVNRTTPTSKGKKETFIEKNLRMEEELAAIRAERAKKYKNLGNQTESSTITQNSNRSNSQSSLRRFWNFDWFTSMFSSRRRGTTQRDRLHLDSNYYRSKNTGCCGPSCGL